MSDFSSLLQQGNAWLFLPSAIVLGALHGLEPGHSKTMMAAFIVAVRGTLAQAVLLGLSATLSHTAVVWLVALAGLTLGRSWDLEASEPYFQLLSALLIVAVALWMLWRTHRQQRAAHDHAHDHDHDHGHGHGHGLDLGAIDPGDAHAQAHAAEIRQRFSHRTVTTGQIVLFGLTGGLIPCPASVTVLLLCLQLKRVALGATLVLGFSVGLAFTLVASGVVAALGVRHLGRRSGRWSAWAAQAPYLSGGLMLLVGGYVGVLGWRGLA